MSQENGRKLPDGWQWVKLGDVSTVVSKGTTPTSLGYNYTSEGIPFLRAEDITNGSINYQKVDFFIDKETNQALSRSQLKPNDLLITIAGTLGRVGYVPTNAPISNCNQAVAFARLKKDLADCQFTCYICQVGSVINPLLDLKAGGTIRNLNLEQIRGLKIPLPPLSEQKRIAAILNEQMQEVERLKQNLQDQLDTINKLPTALLRRAFNGEL